MKLHLAVAPRISVLLPASSDPGAHHIAVQSNVASSFMATPTLALHTNAGITIGQASSVVNAGQSVIWLLDPRFNLMLEGVMTRADGQNGFTISPGVRWAYNFASGLQIVPGVAFPFGFSARVNEIICGSQSRRFFDIQLLFQPSQYPFEL